STPALSFDDTIDRKISRSLSVVFRAVDEGDWDLMHVQGYHTFLAQLGMAAASRKGLPFVVTFHSGGHS
ncbi:glycosyltransferase, partial [Rhizobium leguminosarum]|uniref:glycosyltransferase n=1 Tax=Rhizobium leguminosarum TaxID=384 RepID=UPI003F97CE1E